MANVMANVKMRDVVILSMMEMPDIVVVSEDGRFGGCRLLTCGLLVKVVDVLVLSSMVDMADMVIDERCGGISEVWWRCQM